MSLAGSVRNALRQLIGMRPSKHGTAQHVDGWTLAMETQESSRSSTSSGIIWDKESPASEDPNAFDFREGDYALFHYTNEKFRLKRAWDHDPFTEKE